MSNIGFNIGAGIRDDSEAVYLLNRYIVSDAQLQSYFGGPFNVYPLVADEPMDGRPSYPYIRYIHTPSPGIFSLGPNPWRFRVDSVIYHIGDKDYKNLGKILQRMSEVLDIDDSVDYRPAGLPFDSIKYKIHSVWVVGFGTPKGPDQESGLMERSITVNFVFTVR